MLPDKKQESANPTGSFGASTTGPGPGPGSGGGGGGGTLQSLVANTLESGTLTLYVIAFGRDRPAIAKVYVVSGCILPEKSCEGWSSPPVTLTGLNNGDTPKVM